MTITEQYNRMINLPQIEASGTKLLVSAAFGEMVLISLALQSLERGSGLSMENYLSVYLEAEEIDGLIERLRITKEYVLAHRQIPPHQQPDEQVTNWQKDGM